MSVLRMRGLWRRQRIRRKKAMYSKTFFGYSSTGKRNPIMQAKVDKLLLHLLDSEMARGGRVRRINYGCKIIE